MKKLTMGQFWRKTNHVLALTTLVTKSQSANKECLACHTVGLGAPGGFENVSRLSEFQEVAAQPSTQAFSEFLMLMHGAKDLDQEVKLGTEASSQSLKKWIAKLNQAWTPVQCENCHGPATDHPFGSIKPTKAVADTTCLACHSTERAPSWYDKYKKPLTQVIAQKRALVTCPRSDPEPE